MRLSESAFENSNKNIHSTNEYATLSKNSSPPCLSQHRSRIDISPEFSFKHALEFSKLAVAFAIELGGWKHNDK